MLPEATPLASIALPGAVWNVRSDQVALCDDVGEQQCFLHRNGSIRGVLGVLRTSEFSNQKIDGFCLIGDSLWVIGLHKHFQLSDGVFLDQPINRVAAVGETRVVFGTTNGWRSWRPDSELCSDHPALGDVTRVIQMPGGGFALVRPSAIDFVDEDLGAPVRQKVMIPQHRLDIVGIRRQRQRAIVVLSRGKQWLQIIDEQSGNEKPDWIRLRANGARFDGRTVLSDDLRVALTSAGARDESLTPVAPTLDSSMFHTPQPPKTLRFDVLLITVNDHEFNSVYKIARERAGKDPDPIHMSRTYYDLGFAGGVRVAMVRSQMGSGSPGGTATTTLQAIRDIQPRYIIAVGIVFGVDPDKQKIGQVLYSRQLQCYDLQKVATNEKTGAVEVVPRGDKVTANVGFLDRVDDAAYCWPEGQEEGKPRAVLLLSGDKLVDNVGFKDQLLLLSPEAEGGEMEGSGVYTAASEYGKPWMLIKAICDYADGKKREKKEERQALAAGKAARFAFYLIERGGLARQDRDE